MNDLEDRLARALRAEVAGAVADPLLLSRLPRTRRQRPLLAVLAVAAAVLLVAAGAVLLGGASRSHDSTEHPVRPRPTAQVVPDPFADWGPTRGDLAGDRVFLTSVRKAVRRPRLSAAGPVRLLWAGSTPLGKAAVAVQDVVSRPAGTGSARVTARLVTSYVQHGSTTRANPGAVAGTGTGSYDIGEQAPDPRGLMITLDPGNTSGRNTLVVLPHDRTDVVAVSAAHGRSADGHITRAFTPVPLRHDAVVTSETTDTLVRVVHAGTVLFEENAYVESGAYLQPYRQDEGRLTWRDTVLEPGEALGPPPAQTVQDAQLTDTQHGLGTRATGYDTWYFAEETEALLPLGAARGQTAEVIPYVDAVTQDGGSVMAAQYVLPGEHEHLLVTQSSSEHEHQVLLDELQDSTKRPLWAVRLGHGDGWFVASGPGTHVARWRAPGGTWQPLTETYAALLPTEDADIQLGLSDGSVHDLHAQP